MSVEALMDEGKDLMADVKVVEAEKKFQEVLQLDSRSAEAMVWLGRIAVLNGNSNSAENLLTGALQVKPECAEALVLQGVLRMIEQKYAEAIQLLEKAKTIDPNLEMIYYNLAQSYRKMGDLQRAEDAARRAIGLNPQNFQARGELGVILISTNKMKDGIWQMAEAIRVNPLFVKAYLALAQIYKRTKNYGLITRLFRSGLRANPNAHILREQLCNLYSQTGKSRSAYRQAVELAVRRNFYGDYLRLGSCSLLIGAFDKAEKAFKKSLELNPKSWQGHYNLGELYSAKKQTEQARKEFHSAIDKNGKSGKAFNGLGLLVLHQDKNLAEAKKLFQSAIEREPQSPQPVLNLALASKLSGDLSAAKQFADAAIKLARPGSGIHTQAERFRKSF